MPRCKVYKDVHGLYVRAAGHIFRPDFPVEYKDRDFEFGGIKEGDKVNVSHKKLTVTANLKVVEGDTVETWYSHGGSTSYSPKIKVDSEEIFRPSHDKWDWSNISAGSLAAHSSL